MKTKYIASLLGATALSVMASLPTQAQDQELAELKAQLLALTKKVEALEKKAAQAAVIKKAEPAPVISTSDGKYEMNIRGRIYTDVARVSDSDNTMDIKATEFRAARIGVEGKVSSNIKYRIEADFVGNDVSISDAFVYSRF